MNQTGMTPTCKALILAIGGYLFYRRQQRAYCDTHDEDEGSHYGDNIKLDCNNDDDVLL